MKNILKKHNKEVEKEFDETMVEDWLDLDAHSNRLPVKFNFSDLQNIGELLNPRIKALIKSQNLKLYNKIIEGVEKDKKELKQLVIEDVPHQYQQRLLNKLK